METNKKAFMIGMFMLLSVILMIILVGVIGSGAFFSNKVKYVMYFNESVKGLRKGAKVAFKGVSIGEVVEVNIVLDQKTYVAENQIIVQVDRNRLKTYNDSLFDFGYGVKKMTKMLIDKGLKAQLQMESIVTGVLMINLDFNNNVPIKLLDHNTDYIEIPTMTSGLSQITQTLNKIPLEQMLSKLAKILDNVDELTSNNSISNITKDLDATIRNLKKATSEIGKVFEKLDGEIIPIMNNVNEMVKNADDTFKEFKLVVDNLEGMTDSDSKFRHQLDKTMESMARASKAVETLTDYLNRHPNAVIYGK